MGHAVPLLIALNQDQKVPIRGGRVFYICAVWFGLTNRASSRVSSPTLSSSPLKPRSFSFSSNRWPSLVFLTVVL